MQRVGIGTDMVYVHPSIQAPFGNKDLRDASLLPLPLTLQVRQEGQSLQGMEPGSLEASLGRCRCALCNGKWLTETWPINTTAAFHGRDPETELYSGERGKWFFLQLDLIRNPVLPRNPRILWYLKAETKRL